MAKAKRTTFPGHKVTATVVSVKGECSWGHEAGDTFSLLMRLQGGCYLAYVDFKAEWQ